MVIVLALPLHSVLGYGGFPFPSHPTPLRLQLIVKVPGEFEFCPPLYNIPFFVCRSRARGDVLLNLEDVFETGIEVEQEQDQFVQ